MNDRSLSRFQMHMSFGCGTVFGIVVTILVFFVWSAINPNALRMQSDSSLPIRKGADHTHSNTPEETVLDAQRDSISVSEGSPEISPLEQEARRLVDAWFDSHWTRRGDSAYSISGDESDVNRVLTQLRNPSYFMVQGGEPTSPAEQLNGIQWYGTFQFDATAYRAVRSSRHPTEIRYGEWSAWEDASFGFGGHRSFANFIPKLFVECVKGKWEVQPQGYAKWDHKPDLDSVPKRLFESN